MEPTGRLFLDFSAQELRQLSGRIRDCLGRLNEDQVWMRGNDNQNAIGNLVLHLSGNLRQWIISALGGKPDVRVRDREFSARGEIAITELLERLEGTLEEALSVIETLPPERLAERVTVQKYDLSALEAIYHVVEHFAQHTGQIIFAAKALTGEDLGYYRHLTAAAHTQKTP